MIKNIKYIFILTIMVVVLFSFDNVYATENARVFTTNFFPTRDYDRESAILGFGTLGYNVSVQNDTTAGALFAWTNPVGEEYSNNNYAFYITTHGPNDQQAEQGLRFILGENSERIYPSEIVGNWHLVYIDACNSARDDSWPDSLNITGRTNRAFLGWESDVHYTPAMYFNYYFWRDNIGSCSVEQAMAEAAASVPGEGSTPIAFAGDGTWWGYSPY